MNKTAWIAGASGLVGGHLVRLLSQHEAYEKVIAFVREPVHDKWKDLPKVEQWVVNYDNLNTAVENAHCDDAFCALGTTAKKTPDKNTYYKIDVTYPLSFADLALANGAQFYGLVSAHGASANSFSGYLKMKGTLEEQLSGKEFAHQAHARPGLLKGDRAEFRLGERLAEYLTNLMPGNYKAIQSEDVAAALIKAANSDNQGINILSSSVMQGASTDR